MYKMFLNIWSWINPIWIFLYMYEYYKIVKVLKQASKEPSTIAVLKELKQVYDIELRFSKYYGSIYTVINLEPEIFENSAIAELFVFDKVREINNALTKVMLSDIVTCDMYRESDIRNGAFYYLIVITPNIESLSLYLIIFEILKIALTVYLLCLIF